MYQHKSTQDFGIPRLTAADPLTAIFLLHLNLPIVRMTPEELGGKMRSKLSRVVRIQNDFISDDSFHSTLNN